MTDETIKEDAIKLAEGFTDWMGPSWPIFGGMSATKKLAELANKRFRTAERLAKIEVLEEVLKRWENMYCQDRESRETAVRSMIDELKEANQ